MLSPINVAKMDAAVTAAAGSTAEIIKRLEHLTKWQAEQKKLLEERQSEQRLLLNLEKKQLYEKMGWSESQLEQRQQQHDEVTEARNSVNEGIVKYMVEEFEKLEQNSPDKQFRLSGRSSPADVQLQRTSPMKLTKSACNTAHAKRPFLKRGEGLRQRFKIDPDELRIDNLPPYKYAKARKFPSRSNSSQSVQQKSKNLTQKQAEQAVATTTSLPELDAQEKRFQHLLMSSANHNSTPELKAPNPLQQQMTRAITKKLPQVNFSDKAISNAPSSDANMAWSKILNAAQFTPEQLLAQDEQNLSAFELLEQQAEDSAFDGNSSCIQRLLANKMHTNNMQESTASTAATNSSVQSTKVSEYSTDHTPTANYAVRKVRVHFADEVVSIECNDADTRLVADKDDYDSDETMLNADDVGTYEIQKQQEKSVETSMEVDQSDVNESVGRTVARCDTLDNNAESDDWLPKAEILKSRLAELEKEIKKFKEYNLELIKAKQEHEHLRASLQQEHLEAIEKLNDERVQVEIYLHDERMKIEEEKRKFDLQVRMNKSTMNGKERKEVAKIKAELEEMQTLIKQKDQAHVTSQARLRAQVRNLEKDKKQLLEEIEELVRKNKKLEAENYKARADNSNKMLKEINRNIAKLAPKLNGMVGGGAAGDMENDTTHLQKPITVQKQTHISKTNKKVIQPTARKKKNSISCSAEPHYCTPNEEDSMDEVHNDVPLTLDNASIYDEDDVEFLQELQSLNRSSGQSMPTKQTSTLQQQQITAAAPAGTQAPTQTTDNNLNHNSSNDALKREIINEDGSKDIIYPNGNIKKISADSMNIRMLYFNKDIKETNVNEGTVKYYYAATNTWHTTYLDGLEILEFPNGQTEHRHKNGLIEVHFPNNIVKIIDPNDEQKMEEWRLADGTNVIHMRNGDKVLLLPNGQKEVHTKLNKRREYPDGTVKLVYPDGSQETRYSNGRVRLKDKDGKLIMDIENVADNF